MNILLIGDSFGAPRKGKNGKNCVDLSQTWPVLIKEELEKKGLLVAIDFKPYRMLDEIIDILEDVHVKYDLIVIHAGIVDSFPRPLPQTLFYSKSKWAKFIRKMIKPIRFFWLNHIFCQPMKSQQILEKKLRELFSYSKESHYLLIGITKQFHKEAVNTPKQAFFLEECNKMFERVVSDRVNFLDMSHFNNPCCYSESDSHFNVEGNLMMYQLIKAYLLEKIKN